MTPQFVKPYVKSNKNDASNAEAICETVARPNIRFVPQKSIAQQDLPSCVQAPGRPPDPATSQRKAKYRIS